MSSQELQELPTSSVDGEKEQGIADAKKEEDEEQSPKEAIIRYLQVFLLIIYFFAVSAVCQSLQFFVRMLPLCWWHVLENFLEHGC